MPETVDGAPERQSPFEALYWNRNPQYVVCYDTAETRGVLRPAGIRGTAEIAEDRKFYVI